MDIKTHFGYHYFLRPSQLDGVEGLLRSDCPDTCLLLAARVDLFLRYTCILMISVGSAYAGS